MAKTYVQIVQEIDALQKQAERMRRAELNEVIDRIKSAIAAYGLTASDLGFRAGRATKVKAEAMPATKRRGQSGKGSKVAPKYCDTSGNTWSGRGNRPRWLTAAINEGKKLEDFVI